MCRDYLNLNMYFQGTPKAPKSTNKDSQSKAGPFFNLKLIFTSTSKVYMHVIYGQVVKPGDFKGVPGEGMPQYRNPFEKGNLYIKFDVTFPPQHFADEPQLKVTPTIHWGAYNGLISLTWSVLENKGYILLTKFSSKQYSVR